MRENYYFIALSVSAIRTFGFLLGVSTWCVGTILFVVTLPLLRKWPWLVMWSFPWVERRATVFLMLSRPRGGVHVRSQLRVWRRGSSGSNQPNNHGSVASDRQVGPDMPLSRWHHRRGQFPGYPSSFSSRKWIHYAAGICKMLDGLMLFMARRCWRRHVRHSPHRGALLERLSSEIPGRESDRRAEWKALMEDWLWKKLSKHKSLILSCSFLSVALQHLSHRHAHTLALSYELVL